LGRKLTKEAKGQDLLAARLWQLFCLKVRPCAGKKDDKDAAPGDQQASQTLAAVGFGCGVEERNTADKDKGAAMRKAEELQKA
jgi:hypothetical protein